MAKNGKKEPRKTQEHFLPAEYTGRCSGKVDIDYVNGFPTFGRVRELPADQILHKFEMRLPKPSMEDSPAFEEECLKLFNLPAGELVNKALEKLKTDLDELFKSYLFGQVCQNADGDLIVNNDDEMPEGYSEIWGYVGAPTEAGDSYDAARHILAQEAVDNWRHTPKTASKTVTIGGFIQQVIAGGRCTAEELEGIETQDQLFAKLAQLGIL